MRMLIGFVQSDGGSPQGQITIKADKYLLAGIYALFVLPVLSRKVEPALCWFTSETATSELSRSKRVVGRAVLSSIIISPLVGLLIAERARK